MQGTRSANPMKSSCGGGTSSYQPPQSSHKTTIAVEFQYWLSPIVLTTAATQDGPVSEPVPRWSELVQSGITHETAGRFPFGMSVSIVVSGEMTFFVQSGP